MAVIFGAVFSATTLRKLAPGTSYDAAMRSLRNVFNLATEGGNTNGTPKLATLKGGMCVKGMRLSSSVDLSGLTFTMGTLADPVRYAAAFAGPAANAQVSPPLKIAMQAMDPLSLDEDVFLFPSGALPAAGQVVTFIDVTKR